jgi:hypothetical protein
MQLAEFKHHLQSHPKAPLCFQLPDGDWIPAHAHVTEVGRVDKTFVDCGGTVRRTAHCLLQTWVAEDVDHRLSPEKLASIVERAAPILAEETLPVEVEYEDCATSQFPILSAEIQAGALVFRLAARHTDCLAKEICLPNTCTPGSGCC